ncbi:MAG: hypothetical protein ACPGVY_11955 [Mycobacterium sp.]
MTDFHLYQVRGASFDVSSNGDNVLWTPPQSDRSLILLSFWVSVDGDVEITLRGNHDIGPFAMASGDGGNVTSEVGLIHTDAGQTLRLGLSSGVRCTGGIRYLQQVHQGRGVTYIETPAGL